MTDDSSDRRFSVQGFRRDHVPEDAERELAGLVFMLDEQASIPSVRRLRDWTAAALDPRPGDTVVDVGAGTGTEVQRLAELVGPTGRAVGVEPHPGMRAEATRRAQAAGSSAALVDGDALALPFGDGSVDCLRCERVWQHLTDPDGAAREVARVLAPGGRAVIVDSDWETSILSPGDPDVLRRYGESFRGRMANPLSGRHLRHQLRSSGLEVDPDIGSAAVVLPEELLRRPFILLDNVDLARREGKLTEEEGRDLVDGFAVAVEEGAAFASVTMFAVLARKPGGGRSGGGGNT